MERVLVVAAHPDDEVLGCGGAILRHIARGDAVHVCILGEGITSRGNQTETSACVQLGALREQSEEVAQFLGCESLTLLSFPDNRFDSVPLLELTKSVEACLTDFCPHRIYTHHGGDLNIDHVCTHRAVLTAARPIKGGVPVLGVYTFEIPSSTEWAFSQFAPAFVAQRFVDVAPYLERKVQAMTLYEQEIRAFPHPRSPEVIRAWACNRGSAAGFDAAEAFGIVYEREFHD